MIEENDILNISLDDELGTDQSSPSSQQFEIHERHYKSHVKRLKPLLTCVVCGDNAHGYNFDAISCESCKAFFRRNALRAPNKLKCRGNGHCEITVKKRKRCKKCRLNKCFRMGMRKEWILSDEEKQKKKRKIEENRRLRRSHDLHEEHRLRIETPSKSDDDDETSDEPVHVSLVTNDLPEMTTSNWLQIQRIQASYAEAIRLHSVTGVPLYPSVHHVHSAAELVRVPTYLASRRLMTYFMKLPEFSLLDPEDRVILVKYNILSVVFMHSVLIYNPATDTYHEHNTDDPLFEGKDWSTVISQNFHYDATHSTIELIRILEYDRVIVKIMLIILLFTKGFCAYDLPHEPSLNNPSLTLKIQNKYVELLYKYSLHQYGLPKTLLLFTRLVGQLFVIQRLAEELKHIVHDNVDVSELSPLMQSVMQLTDSAESDSTDAK